jgi:ATP-dependent DNA helicase DinG
MDVTAVLGPGGLVSRRLSSFEERPEQLRMAKRIEECLRRGRHLLVEAGTGVGKSFAYLVPAILRAGEADEKVVVATHTISLQEQLLGKDLPFLSGILPAEFSVVLAKGRRNYLCRRRLQTAVDEEQAFFDFVEEKTELRRIARWAGETEDGSLQDLDPAPSEDVWSRVCAETGACLGRRCRMQDKCHFQQARRRLQNANVVIANHALFFSDLSLRAEGANLLPDYDILVVDEAHEMENSAAEHLGLRVSNAGLRVLLSRLAGRKGKGLLAAVGAGPDTLSALERCRAGVERFFEGVSHWAASGAPRNLRVPKPDAFEDTLSGDLLGLSRGLEEEAEKAENEDLAFEVKAAAEQFSILAGGVRAFVSQELEGQIYWLEPEEEARRITLRSAPVRVGARLSELVFSAVRCVVLTSATLTVGKEAPFAFFRDRLGIEDAEEEALGSPFDYQRQAKIHLPLRMPDPRDEEAFEAALVREVLRAVSLSDGGTFVLFTSYRMLDRVHGQTREALEERGRLVLRQGGGMPRSRMLERFREDGGAVLFGTDSFWQGVDVPGDALAHVIITKLPFEVPDRPLVEARTQEIDARGGNSFMEYSLPRAVIRLRQGFGRLIRTKEDRGVVTILDPRVTTKRYGRLFLDSLPPCEIVRG